MIKLSLRQNKIIEILLKKKNLSSSMIHSEILKLGEEISLITIKRELTELVNNNFLEVSGLGRSTKYSISILGRVFANIDFEKYCDVEPDKRYGLNKYNFDLISSFPSNIFSDNEFKILENATKEFRNRTKKISKTIKQKELERLIIEISWKSSKIEGNTYSLLETEKLILENKVAIGRTKEETQMILNHKDAFNFILKNKGKFKKITRKNLEELHSILIKKLNVKKGLREHPVGITGSVYRPLDNIYQISEALDILIDKISKISSPYVKTFLILLGLSYIQPFEDGNKRTSRLLANAILLANNLAPLSYRSVDIDDYRKSILVFYELNSIIPFKKIFIEQYDFSAKNYSI